MKNFFTFLFLSVCFQFNAQKFEPFIGKLTYEVLYYDSMTKAAPTQSFMTIYTNDTLVRIETETVQLGKQITIKHLPLKKYYILLEVNEQKYAIQHHEAPDTISHPRYQFKKGRGHKKFDGHKAKALYVTTANGSFSFKAWYFKDLNPIYNEAIKGMPGLPVEYDIATEDGVYHYRLIEFRKEGVKKEAFGVPSAYKRVSFDEFMEQMLNSN